MEIKDVKAKLEWIFSDLEFEEETHSYFVNSTKIPSVSSLVNNHASKTNFKVIKEAIAKRDYTTVEEITNRWAEANKTACDLGHKTHSYAENYTGEEEPQTPQERGAKKFLEELPEYYEIIFKELKMHHRELKYAGTADLILFDKRYGTIVIADYKTNKDLYKNYKEKKLLPPFQFLLDNPYNKYQIQLSYYQLMIEQSGYKVSNRFIIYLDKEGNYSIIPTDNYTNELEQILKSK